VCKIDNKRKNTLSKIAAHYTMFSSGWALVSLKCSLDAAYTYGA